LFIGASNALTGDTISGSAIIVEESEEWSWAISAGHVCYPEPQDTLVMLTDVWVGIAFTFRGEYAPLTMVALDQENDVCIFKIPMTGMPVAKLASEMPEIGEKVYLGAYPLGIYNPGHVPFFEGYYAGLLEGKASYTIPVTGGASGGGVVNKQGELVGVISMAIEGFENITLVPKLENVQTLLDVAKKNPERLTIIR
jgi:S1-C subfamily serine protease